MKAGVGERVRRAMGWILRCFHGHKENQSPKGHERKHDVFSNAYKRLRKVSTRRDKAQVQPDSTQEYRAGVEDHKKLGKGKSFQQFSFPHELPCDPCGSNLQEDAASLSRSQNTHFSREEHMDNAAIALNDACDVKKKGNREALPSSTTRDEENDTRVYDKESNAEDYLNIEAVFTASLFPNNGKENFATEDLITTPDFFLKNHQRGSIFTPLENLPASNVDEDSLSSGNKSQQFSFDEKPIMGLVTAQSTESEPEVKSYKTWDGKGIPNSPSKYKEDQQVTFHTIPFEARLERALANQLDTPSR